MARRRNSIQKWIDLDRDDVHWLEETYPGISYSALMTMLLREFRKVHAITPADYAMLGAVELKKALEDT